MFWCLSRWGRTGIKGNLDSWPLLIGFRRALVPTMRVIRRDEYLLIWPFFVARLVFAFFFGGFPHRKKKQNHEKDCIAKAFCGMIFFGR